MKTTAVLAALALPAFAQTGGSLTPPPGAPAPAMKSLDRVEPRVPLVSGAPGVTIGVNGTITIHQPGSYYLTGNLTVTGGNGITINSSGVTLDLMGFRIGTSGSSGNGIQILNFADVIVQNGIIASSVTYDGSTFTGNGFATGILAISNPGNVTIRHVTVSGVTNAGISLTNVITTSVDSCSVRVAGGTGIQAALVRNCDVYETGATGIIANTVENSRSWSVGSSGITASMVSGSFGVCMASSGIAFGISGISVTASRGESTRGHGINASYLASHSYGVTTSASPSSHGISSGNFGSVDHCVGIANIAGSGNGIDSFASVTHSTGSSRGQNGIQAGLISSCYGYAYTGAGHGLSSPLVVHSRGGRQSVEASKYGIIATTAVGSHAVNGASITNKYNMP